MIVAADTGSFDTLGIIATLLVIAVVLSCSWWALSDDDAEQPAADRRPAFHDWDASDFAADLFDGLDFDFPQDRAA